MNYFRNVIRTEIDGRDYISVRLNNREGSTLELFIREHWLAKNLLNNSVLPLHLVMYLF